MAPAARSCASTAIACATFRPPTTPRSTWRASVPSVPTAASRWPARKAVANGDGSEVQLLGGAEITSQDAAGLPMVMRSEFLHFFVVAGTGQLQSEGASHARRH
jgi:hypothetical protein